MEKQIVKRSQYQLVNPTPLLKKSSSIFQFGRILSGLLGAFCAFAILDFISEIKNQEKEYTYNISKLEQLENEYTYSPYSTLNLAIETFQSLAEELSFLIISAKDEFNLLVLNKQPKELTIVGDIPIEGGVGGLDHIISLAEFYRENLAEKKLPIKSKLALKDRETEIKIDNLSNTPIGSPTIGEITSEFGIRISPFTNRRSFHSGIDIAITEGSKVVASADGYVLYAGRKGGYGKMVHLKHENGKETLYAHLSKVNILPGHKVTRGQIIGKVGSTGQSTGSHLHYEVRHNGTPVNPKPYIQMAKSLKMTNK